MDKRLSAEEILDKHFPHSYYYAYGNNIEKNKLHDDKCVRCELNDELISAMEEYRSQPAPQGDVSILLEALEEIMNPIKFMRDRLEEGEVLNGIFANQLSNDANYLKDIARKGHSSYQSSINKP